MAISKIGSDALAAGAPSRSQLPAGTVLQVVQGTLSAYFATTSTTVVDTGLNATITPTSASSKVLVMVNINGISTATNTTTPYEGYIYLFDGAGSNLALIMNNFVAGSASAQIFNSASGSYLISPATTSPITYKVRVKGNPSGNGITIGNYQNTQPVAGEITLMEIAA